jgi:carbonic anhydrase
MADKLDILIDSNRVWADAITRDDPTFFSKLSSQQSPEYLWVGCSDSRVPANQIVDLLPGELFVHRNVANIVLHTDLNCQSVLQYAVDVLKVKHIIVCGHYGCGGVAAAMQNREYGLIDYWLRNIRDIYYRSARAFEDIPEGEQRVNLMCELNVLQQLANTCHSNIVQAAWARGQKLTAHGWIYSIRDGLLKDLGASVDGPDQIPKEYRIE